MHDQETRPALGGSLDDRKRGVDCRDDPLNPSAIGKLQAIDRSSIIRNGLCFQLPIQKHDDICQFCHASA
jgi:hypothetical protein